MELDDSPSTLETNQQRGSLQKNTRSTWLRPRLGEAPARDAHGFPERLRRHLGAKKKQKLPGVEVGWCFWKTQQENQRFKGNTLFQDTP